MSEKAASQARIKELEQELVRLKSSPIWLEITDANGTVTRDKATLDGNPFRLQFDRRDQ